ncbi:MAG: hypothetical protein ACFWUC_07950 [Oscillospiraceae bacterium]|jgi:hypothetical protein
MGVLMLVILIFVVKVIKDQHCNPKIKNEIDKRIPRL